MLQKCKFKLNQNHITAILKIIYFDFVFHIFTNSISTYFFVFNLDKSKNLITKNVFLKKRKLKSQTKILNFY